MTDPTPLNGPTLPLQRGHLTRQQAIRTMTPVRADRVETKQGMSYIPQHEVRAELIRTFGPGNVDHTMGKPEFMWETELHQGDPGYPQNGNGKPYYVVCFMVGCTLRVRSYEGLPVYECTEYHAEANSPLPNRGEAYAMAITSAESYALRRAAISLGDNFGLHLYDKGSVAPLIKNTLYLKEYLPPSQAEKDAEAKEAAEQKAAETPDAPAAAPRTRKPATAPQDAPVAPAAPVPNLDDAFKKPTAARQAAPKAAAS